ncbi:MAG: PBP1A family penicillin-binding protein [Candidatus Paceibacterota bacterium]
MTSFQDRKVVQSTKIYDRTGKVLLFDIHKNIARTVVPYSEISRNLKNATVAIEDSNFYNHFGIEPLSIIRATLVNLASGQLKQGGSTITQQVVKNSVLNNDKSFSRKLKEVILSFKLERTLTKEEILSLYLNEIPYGGNIYGAEQASQKFFGKSAKEVTLAESAYLAAIPNAPTFYSPYGNNRDKLELRKNLVLDKMTELGFIKKDEVDAAKKESVTFLTQGDNSIKAPHFVNFVRLYLEGKYGEDKIENGGLKVITSLDWDLQQKAEEVVKKYGDENEKKFNAKNAGAVVVDPKTGQILAMVGSRDYFDVEKEGNFNVTIARRQPGSSFKPFVYATAFKKGYTPETVLFDLQTQFDTNCTPDGKPLKPSTPEIDAKLCYTPQNYDGKFRGPMILRDALAQSINIPAIKTLYLAGIKDSIDTARNMGVTGLSNQNQYGLTLVLGGGEVSLLDMTSAYSVFANDGIRNPYTSIIEVQDGQNNVLEQFSPSPQRVLDEDIARTISDILSDQKAREPIFGPYTPLQIPGYDVAAKTGTTNDYKDAWSIGYSPTVAVGTWAGNNDNTPMDHKIAGLIVVPIWHDIILAALAKYPNESFGKPEKIDSENLKPVLRGVWNGGKEYSIDKISGKLATEFTPPEYIQKKAITSVHSILYWLDKDNPWGDKPATPENDPQFNLWETQIRKWALENGFIDQNESSIPKVYDDVHKPEYAQKVIFLSPDPTRLFWQNETTLVSIVSSGKYLPIQADLFVNNVFVGTSKSKPFTFNLDIGELQDLNQENTIKVVVYDEVGNKTEATSLLYVNKK